MRPLSLVINIFTGVLIIIGHAPFSPVEAVEHHGYNANNLGKRDDCLSCHNDNIAKSHSNCMPICFFGKSHPDNRDYPPLRRKDEFQPVAVAEQSGIMFIDGKMDCISCHSLQVKSRYHLRNKDWQKQLCSACHKRL
jgi:hypothetical protein